MVEQGKSYRSRGVNAPYRRPVSSGNRYRPSLLNKVKSFFKNSSDTNEKQDSDIKQRYLNNNVGSSVSIPGGFFSADDASSSINLLKHQKSPQTNTSALNVDAVSKEGNNEEISDEDESCSADVSNAKLADFFSHKGEEPLSEMEMEGVKSLMRKSSKSVKSSRRGSTVDKSINHNDPADIIYSRVLNHSRTPSLAASTVRAPAFSPRYDESFSSQSLPNTSKSSASKRRVFDYSSLPSPYKTTVYKYSAADKNGGDIHDGSKSIDSSKSMVAKPGNNKRLSNTASALVSLLDNNSSQNEASNLLANPYSSHVNQIRKYKKTLPTLPSAKQEPAKPAPLKPSASQELGNAKGNLLNEANHKSQPQNSIDKYKPMRSSSLRSNVVKAEESPERKATSKEIEPEVPKAPTFNFQFQTKGPTEVNSKLESPKPSQPQVKVKPDAKPGFAFKFQPQKFDSPDNNSDHDSNDKRSVEVPKINSTLQPTVGSTDAIPQYDFGGIASSNVDPSTIDEKRVQEFKTLFIF